MGNGSETKGRKTDIYQSLLDHLFLLSTLVDHLDLVVLGPLSGPVVLLILGVQVFLGTPPS